MLRTVSARYRQSGIEEADANHSEFVPVSNILLNLSVGVHVGKRGVVGINIGEHAHSIHHRSFFFSPVLMASKNYSMLTVTF